MGSGTEHHGTTPQGTVALAAPDDPFRSWRELQDAVEVVPGAADGRPTVERVHPLPPDPSWTLSDPTALEVLDDPRLVLTDGYIGVDRRTRSLRGTVRRAAFGLRGKLLRLDLLIVMALVAVAAGAALVVTLHPAPRPRPGTTAVGAALPTDPLGAAARTPELPSTTVPAPSTTVPVPTTAPPAPAPQSVATPVGATTPTPATPQAMGAAALAMVRYPWQQIPGYSIQFLPIADAPSPGFYGNTDFTWGQAGGVSTLYVYPGETVERLAGIVAFEIGHEVDAAYVEPEGGHAQIEAALGVDPASWAPECDCAEQGYLSGWYAAAFSDYWSPGVGAWSTLAPPPTGATLAAVEPWLDPRVS